MQLQELVRTHADVAATRSRKRKVERLAALLACLDPDDREIGVPYLAGELRQGKVGIGPALVRAARGAASAPAPSLALADVDRTLTAIGSIAGRGAKARRTEALQALLERATPDEEAFLARLLVGEVLALAPDGRPHPFQVTMARFGRRLDVEAERERRPLTAFFFDLLYADGREWLDRPNAERWAELERVVPAEARVPRTSVEDAAALDEAFAAALEVGHEGVVVKALDAPYAAGRRGAHWRKLKPAHALDLVVLAAEWGSGRRRGWLSNLHLGALDPGRLRAGWYRERDSNPHVLADNGF